MDLKRKLAHLNGAGISRADRPLLLDELRAKMAAIAPRAIEPAVPHATPETTSLPFALEDTALGPLCRRHRILPPSFCVGRMPVSAARDARAELLSLLALDPALSACRLDRALFLDTETSGLGGGAGVVAFLVGLAWFDEEGQLHAEQLLLRNPGEEPALLEWLRTRLEQAELIVTYNGKAFDWPLLGTRFVMNRLRVPEKLPHLDLLHIARRLHRARLGGCRLAMLESDVLGFERGPDVDGAEIPARYAHFLRTGDEQALAMVVEHNSWDVASMAALVGLYGEPLELLPAADLVGMARTLKRGRALEFAHEVADRAIARGAELEGRRVRGEIAKARGDRDLALADFEHLAREVDDPRLRLELAKLYEHHVKAPEKALELVLSGTGEGEAAEIRRRSRLERKARGR